MNTAPDPAGDALFAMVGFLLRSPEENGPSAADRAALRRMDPREASLPPAMWRLLTHPKISALTHEPLLEAHADQVLAIVAKAVLDAGTSNGTAIGRALGDSRYAEQRFVRLLRARALPDLAYQVRQAAIWCAGKGVWLQFLDGRRPDGFGRYILAAGLGRPEADWRARAIARDYFSAAHAAGEPASTEP